MNLYRKIQDVGQDILAACPAKLAEEEKFCATANRALEKARLDEEFNMEELVGWVAGANPLPGSRVVDNFGQPAITLFESDWFYIDLYFWLTPEISIHDHAFCGAFTVISGESLHVKYDFQVSEQNRGVETGELVTRSIEPLHMGDVERIESGRALIHQVWHLTRPTVSLVVRTFGTRKPIQQCNYYRRGLAVGNSHQAGLKTQLNLLRYLLRSGWERNSKLIISLLTHASPTVSFYGLLELERLGGYTTLLERLRNNIGSAYGSIGQVITDTANYQAHQIPVDLAAISDSDQRFLLAVLTSASNRQQILDAVRARCGSGGVEEQVRHWVAGIVESVNGASVENDLAIDIIGESASGVSYRDIRTRLQRRMDGDQQGVFDDYYEALRNLPLFANLVPERGSENAS